ncbi:MAG: phage minor head protein [Syntrophobacteraceae bacterium]
MSNMEAFDLPFDEAIDFFKAKGTELSPGGWRDVWRGANAKAFTVARVTNMDVLRDIRDEVRGAIAAGTTIDEFKKNLIPMLQRKGWWTPDGEKAKTTLPDGTVRKRLTPWRLENIFDTNLQTAYSVGRYKQMMETAEARPYWQYKAILDASTRPTHAAQNGKVYDYRHPFWAQWLPPNGFHCRCYVKTLTGEDVKDRGLTVETVGTDLRPDEGWDYNPGEAGIDGGWKPDLGKYPASVKQRFLEDLADGICPDDWEDFSESACRARLKKQLTQGDMEDMETVLWARKAGGVEGYPEWAAGVLENRKPKGELYPIGNLPDKVLARLSKQPRLALVVIDDSTILHMARSAKAARGASLTSDEIASIPEKFEGSDWYRDAQDPALLMTWVRSGEDWVKIVVRTDHKVGKGTANMVVTGGVVKGHNITVGDRYEKF